MNHPYKTRQNGATVTVFVPYDCGNHCPFCINKEEYADSTGFSADQICRSIVLMDALTPRCDFVFTGGEPLADLNALQRMLDLIPGTHRIFINTTLPVSQNFSERDLAAFTAFNRRKIYCMNVSRHLQHYVQESPDELLHRLAVPFRINCVLYQDYPAENLVPFLERFHKIPGASVQFRFDYTATTPENLCCPGSDRILRDLRQIAEYTGLDGCRMRCGFHFDYRGMELTYHRTLPYSTITERDPASGVVYNVLYDILIKQNGDLHADWDGTPLDVAAYRQAALEPYDLCWREYPSYRPVRLTTAAPSPGRIARVGG